jgi:hypothetical protein
MWGRMPLPPIHICPQEPWEAQEYAHRDRSRVKFSFCERPGVETRPERSGSRRGTRGRGRARGGSFSAYYLLIRNAVRAHHLTFPVSLHLPVPFSISLVQRVELRVTSRDPSAFAWVPRRSGHTRWLLRCGRWDWVACPCMCAAYRREELAPSWSTCSKPSASISSCRCVT